MEFLIFLLLPPKTILGPITGGAIYNKSNNLNYIIRKFCFPIFYKITEIIIHLRSTEKIVFSTDLLKKYLFKRTIENSDFNFVLKISNLKKRENIKILIF